MILTQTVAGHTILTMSIDRNRLHRMATELDRLAKNCRDLERRAAAGREILSATTRNGMADDLSPEELAVTADLFSTWDVLTGPNLLIWRNIGRTHQSVRSHDQ